MKVVIINVRSGIEARWFRADEDTLVIRLATDLDEVTRQRYIAQAKAENGITDERRRRTLIPLLPFFGQHATGHSKSAAAVAVGSGVVAAGVAAAVVIPAALDSDQEPSHQKPAAAAPAPTRPGPPAHRQPSKPAPDPPGQPGWPGQPEEPGPTPPSSPLGTRVIPRHPVHTVLGPTPVRHLVGAAKPRIRLPLPPVKPPRRVVVQPRRQPALIDLQLPRAGVRVRIRPRLSAKVRLGSLRLQPTHQP